MAVRKAARKSESEPTGDAVERKVVALAEQLGWVLGTVQAKPDGWLDRGTLQREIGRIRDGAAELLDHVNRASAKARKVAAMPAGASTMRASRGPVDAPGKRHRKPPPQESLDKRMGEPVGKQMGQKSIKNRGRSGRG